MIDPTPADDTPTASLTITRTGAADVKQRQVVVSLDGRPLATLLYGQSASRAIEPGAHRLRVHNTLVWKTVDFEAGPGERVLFEVSNRPGLGTRTLVAMLGVGPLYLTLARKG